MRDYLIQRVNALKLSHRTDRGGNLMVEVPAEQCPHDAVLVLSGHMDVVPPCLDIEPVVTQSENDTVIASNQSTVLGADDKAGLTPILEAVALAIHNNLPRPALRLIFTTREETQLEGAKELDDAALKANFAVTFDHTGKQGVIIHKAPSYVHFKLICKGKSVHAGIMPEQGVNAIVFAGKVIRRLPQGRIDAETTANIGFFNGGKGTNVVPDHVEIEGELRSHQPETLKQLMIQIQKILDEEKHAMPGTDYELMHQTEFDGYELASDHPGIALVKDAMRAIEIQPQLIASNGGSDNNVFVKRGLPGVVLSAGYVEPHALSERVKLSEMVLCTRLILSMFSVFAQRAF